MKENRVLVCGGRNYDDKGNVYATLDQLYPPATLIIHGAARGADALAAAWAVDRGVPVKAYPADWSRWGRAAGAIRNQQMISESQPHLVVAFPGGRGTADMVQRAKAAGLLVIERYK